MARFRYKWWLPRTHSVLLVELVAGTLLMILDWSVDNEIGAISLQMVVIADTLGVVGGISSGNATNDPRLVGGHTNWRDIAANDGCRGHIW
ncbi:hypothetical protein SY83_11145 [Paenibacillus swuensis]|uniref:Uncharacterized protein n=1 Tax=Paenibacillus swuensis TaxID=1178515 RepID=A0A172TIF3_9BACL|nr:hypothetical protein SY83_11145 [Paenibacillus swuensis]